MKKISITTFAELLQFIESNDLTIEQMNALSMTALGCLSIYATTKEEFIETLKAYWQEWGDRSERPIFADNIDLDVR